MLTVNEIFCREDYYCNGSVNVVVDLGSNIGLSALYFLSRNDKAKVYLFEPDPKNYRGSNRTWQDMNPGIFWKIRPWRMLLVHLSLASNRRAGTEDGVATGEYIEVSCLNINDVWRMC